jgi:serine protease Do
VDLNGRVVGINTAIASSTGLYAGYGFAIPINLARTVARDLIELGRVKRSWLGILFTEVDARIAMARSLPDNPPIGALVTEVTAGGSADEAGMETDDIILEIDGIPIENSGQLQTMVSTKRPGSRITVTVYRGGNSRREGRRIDLTITLQERPEDTSRPAQEAAERESDRLGFDVEELTRAQAREYGYSGEGVLVTGVEQYGPSYDVGFRNGGFILIEVDGERVESVRDYNRILEELRSGSYVIVKFYNPQRPEGRREDTATIRVR